MHASQYGLAELRAAADEVHRLGLAIAGHALGAQAVADAVAAGFDGIEHCGFFTANGVQTDPAVMAAMAARSVFVSSTGAVAGSLAQSIYDADILQRLPDLIGTYQRMRAAVVPLAMSSDAGVTPAKPHDVLPFDVGLLRRLGYSTADALRAITTVPAAACGLGDRKGRVAAGYDADLVAVTGNPLADVKAVHDVAAVFGAGLGFADPLGDAHRSAAGTSVAGDYLARAESAGGMTRGREPSNRTRPQQAVGRGPEGTPGPLPAGVRVLLAIGFTQPR